MKTKSIFTTLLFSLFFVCLSYGQTKVKHGLIIGGGGGACNNAKIKLDDFDFDYPSYDLKARTSYKFNIVLGYKIRIQPDKALHFFDVDILATAKKIDYSLDYYEGGIYYSRPLEGNNIYCSSSINLNYNYYVFKKLYVGVGLEPTLYFASMDGFLDKLVCDMPVTAKIGYDFRFVDISIGYKYGFINSMKLDKFKSGKMNDWQIQLFIPF